MMQTESSNENTTVNGLPEKLEQFGEELKYQIGKMHDQFKIKIETDHANKLAKEIRDVYCQLSTTKKNQTIILSQTNGLLAASAIGLPVCSRIQGLGQTMILQQCAVKTVALTAIETECGFQPFFTYANENYTIGMDGWSIHPYSECFWKSHFVNLNGNAFAWEHNLTNGEWIKQSPTIHTAHLELIAEFEELKLNDFDLALKAHPAHDVMRIESLNILNDLAGRLHGTELKALSDIIVTDEQDNNIGSMFSWFDTLKIMGLCTIGFILFLISIRLFIACKILPKISKVKHSIQNSNFIKSRNKQAPTVELEEMLNVKPESVYNSLSVNEPTFVKKYAPLPLHSTNKMNTAEPSAPRMSTTVTHHLPRTDILNKITSSQQKKADSHKCLGPHTTCSYVVGHGMVWEDLCRCDDKDTS